MRTQLLRPAVSLLIAFTLLLGIAYPFVDCRHCAPRLSVTGRGAACCAEDGRVIGSRLIGQVILRAEVLLGPAVGDERRNPTMASPPPDPTWVR